MIWAGRITEAAARLERLGLGHVDAEALATALIDDAAGWVHLKAAGHLLALVSNTEWRSAARYREDFAGWQADDCFDAYVTSLDVGFRKPHAGMFQRALELLGAAPGDTVMIGNSPRHDMAPAKELGLRTVLGAIQSPPGDTSAADAVVRSMSELRDLLLPRGSQSAAP